MLDRQNMNATVYSRKRPIEIVIISAVMVVSLMFVGGYTIIMGACFSLVGIYIRRVLKRAGPQRGAV